MMTKISLRRPSDEGFTLIEIVTVLVLLGIIGSIAAAKYFDMKDKADEQACVANRAVLASEVRERWAGQILDGASSSDVMIKGIFNDDMTDKPVCPSGGRYTIDVTSAEDLTFTINCSTHFASVPAGLASEVARVAGKTGLHIRSADGTDPAGQLNQYLKKSGISSKSWWWAHNSLYYTLDQEDATSGSFLTINYNTWKAEGSAYTVMLMSVNGKGELALNGNDIYLGSGLSYEQALQVVKDVQALPEYSSEGSRKAAEAYVAAHK